MSVLQGATTVKASEEDVVWSEDPDVVVPAELQGCGWIPADACKDRPGADTLRIRGLTAAERSRSRDVWARQGEASMNHFVARAGTVRWNKEKKAEKVAARVDELAQREAVALDLLAHRILLITRGVDPADGYAFCRQSLGYEEPPKSTPAEGGEEAADAGGSKSSDG